MNTTQLDIKQYVLPLYLGIVLLILIPLTFWSILISILPLLFIALSIYYQKEDLALISFSVFFLFSLTQLRIESIEQITQLFGYSIFLLLPSLLLLSQLLKQTRIEQTIQSMLDHPKAFAVNACIALCFLLLIYLIPFFVGNGLLFNRESVQEQIILIIGISIIVFTPFLLKRSKIDLTSKSS